MGYQLPMLVGVKASSKTFVLFVWFLLKLNDARGDIVSTAGVYLIQSETLEGHRLANHVFRTLTVSSLMDCSRECVRDICCASINYKKDSSCVSAEGNCELNRVGSSNSSENLIKDDMYLHFDVLGREKENFCCPSPCLNDNTCDAVLEECQCSQGFGGKFCEAIGSTNTTPATSCKEILLLQKNAASGHYRIKPISDPPTEAFLAYCDMITEGGGWTLVFKYTFTNYSNFSKSSNAITPRPNWPASQGDTPVSTTAPTEATFGAVDFQLWPVIGKEFLVKSTINDWIVCQPGNGSMVRPVDGDIQCRNIKNVATDCEGIAPNSIAWRGCGPRLASLQQIIYRFDVSTANCYPAHNPCDDPETAKHHKKNVANPEGAIFLR